MHKKGQICESTSRLFQEYCHTIIFVRQEVTRISKLAMCNPWSRSGSNSCDIFSEYNCSGTLSSSGINNKWKINMSVARMNDTHFLAEMIEIRDGFKRVLHFK